MNTKQTNRVTMFKTVIAYMDDNTSVWNTMTPLQTAVTNFKARVAAIDATALQQEAPKGATIDKAEARDALEDVLFLTCEALGALGHASNDNDLLVLAEVNRSSLDRLDAEELSRRATDVLAQANARKTELVPLQVTQENLDELAQALQDYDAAKAGPRKVTAARAAHTESLSELFREASGILRNQIDRMVSLFDRSNSNFVSGYKTARVIVDRAATHAKPTHPIPAPTPTPTPSPVRP